MQAIPTIQKLILLQRAFYAVLSTSERRPWGLIWANPENPNSHDSNHADLEDTLPARQLPDVLQEITESYGERGLPPRLRFFIPPNDAGLVQVAEGLGWKSAIQDQTFRAWPSSADLGDRWPVPGLTLSVVGRTNSTGYSPFTAKEGMPRRRSDIAACGPH